MAHKLDILLVLELAAGVAALVLTAMAFTHLSWSEGASSGAMQRASLVRSKRLFWWAGGFWALCLLCYLLMR
jgi:hypothetical protein